jgi:hypothetical protein
LIFPNARRVGAEASYLKCSDPSHNSRQVAK